MHSHHSSVNGGVHLLDGFAAECTAERLNGGTMTCEDGSQCSGLVASGVMDCEPGSTCSGDFAFGGSLYCHDGAICNEVINRNR